MLILAIDSAMNGCSAGVHDFENNIHVTREMQISRGQAEHLMPMIDDVIREAAISYDDIDKIAVTHGPGAFTGLRVAMSTAKALGLALNIPVIGVCTFDAVFHTFVKNHEGEVNEKSLILLETKRKDYYIRGVDEEGTAFTEKTAISAQEASSMLADVKHIIGDALSRYENEIAPQEYADINKVEVNMPDNEVIAYIGKNAEYKPCEPAYIRPPDAVASKNIRSIK